jgi:hypothetical protein
MAHPNTTKRLKTYGPLAVKLARLDDAVDATDGASPKWDKQLKLFTEFCDSEQVRNLIVQLAADKYGAIRTIAASSMLHLWEAQNLLPYKPDDPDTNERASRQYVSSLDWTIPLLLTAVTDPRGGPAVHAIEVASWLNYAEEATCRKYSEALISVRHSRHKYVRLAVAKQIALPYPMNEKAMHTLDEAGMQCLLDLCKDRDLEVAEWACFCLHLYVANADDRAIEVFRQAMERDPSDYIYLEGVIGLARLTGDEEVIRKICERLELDEEFEAGWVNAAAVSHHPECLMALISAHQRILAEYPDDSMIEYIERDLVDWNDDVWARDDLVPVQP